MEKEINKFHALQLFTDTFAAETVHLTNNKIGIYIRLLCFAWTKNAKPFTTESAFRICQCTTNDCYIDVYEVLEEFFKVERECDDRNKKTWYHKRLLQEHEYLTDKYQRKSRAGKKGAEARYSANGNIIAPIPSPIPIPNNKYDVSFEELWKALHIRRGSKFKAFKLWQKLSPELPEDKKLINIYNSQIHGIEKKYIPHFTTWLSEKRWESDHNEYVEIPNLIERLKNLGYTYIGSEGNFEKFSKDGKNYRIDRLDEKHLIQLEQ